MFTGLSHISLLVADYDEAIGFYVGKMGFVLLEDTRLTDEKRWVRVAPPGGGTGLLLAKAANEEQKRHVGNQTGGRVFLFLHTNNFDEDFRKLVNHGITVFREPSVEPYGKVAVIADCYGNLWDIIEPVEMQG